MAAGNEEKIGDWTVTQLSQYLANQREETTLVKSPIITCDELFIAEKITIFDEIQFTQSQTTVGAAGGASALPATPKGYFKVKNRDGVNYLIPFYNR